MSQKYDRMLFFGQSVLADGYALVGFETWPDADKKVMEQELLAIHNRRENAFVIIDASIDVSNSSVLSTIKRESGRILIIEVPELSSPESFSIDTDDRVGMLMGQSGV